MPARDCPCVPCASLHTPSIHPTHWPSRPSAGPNPILGLVYFFVYIYPRRKLERAKHNTKTKERATLFQSPHSPERLHRERVRSTMIQQHSNKRTAEHSGETSSISNGDTHIYSDIHGRQSPSHMHIISWGASYVTLTSRRRGIIIHDGNNNGPFVGDRR